MQKALLYAALQPHNKFKELQNSARFTELLVMQEELKTYPFGEVWEQYCINEGVPAGSEWFAEVEKYENEVLSKRV